MLVADGDSCELNNKLKRLSLLIAAAKRLNVYSISGNNSDGTKLSTKHLYKLWQP